MRAKRVHSAPAVIKNTHTDAKKFAVESVERRDSNTTTRCHAEVRAE